MKNLKSIFIILSLLACFSLWMVIGCGDDDDDDNDSDDDDGDDDDDDSTGFTLTSTSFESGGTIPQKYSCDNADYATGVSPQLSWTNPPEGTLFFAITMFDPDANDTPHWGVFSIPPTVTELADELRPDNSLPENAWEAIVYTGIAEYAGPCPPPGETHNYKFTVYALNEAMPDFAETPDLADMVDLLEELEIDSASLTASFGH